MIGETLAHFNITAKLGVGGMGEVYQAEDSKLGRNVAIKVLPDVFAQDAERMARFGREAQVLASLNHKNIAGIFQLEHDKDLHFLVMELVEGDTLAERIKRGRMALDEVVPVALQIAEALEAAHEQGIVHRDLKPANIKFTANGQVKVLDFGLAKALESGMGSDSDPSHPSISLSPTLTANMTGVGVLLGTAAYMSPEQARGQAADRRADVWAFGIVLMEMLIGRTVYAGQTVSDTLAGVLAREPEWDALPADLPPILRSLLQRCLQKEVGDRLQAIGEARIALAEYLADPEAAQAAAPIMGYAPQPTWRRMLPWAALALAGVATVAAIAGWTRSPHTPPAQTMRLNVEIPVEETLLTQIGSSVVLSPDGTYLAYVTGDPATRALHLRPLNQLDGIDVSGGELSYLPFFSHDGQWLAFVTPTELKKVSVSGGAPLTIAEVNFCRGASWGPDDRIIFTPDQESGLFRIPATGGEPEELTQLDTEKGEVTHRWPSILPNGEAVLFVSHTQNSSFSEATIEVLDLESGERKVLVRGGTYPRYASSGHLLYVRQGTLFAIPMDPDTLEVSGSPGPIIEGLTTNEGNYGTAHYSVSETGTLVYMEGSEFASSYGAVLVARDGNMSPLLEGTGSYWAPAFSPDGSRLALDIADNTGNGDIWIEDLDRGIHTRLTFDAADDTGPIWSPDGEWIYFQSNRAQSYDIFRVAADGSELPVRLTETESDQGPSSVTPDGKTLLYAEQTPENSWDIYSMPLSGEVEPEIFLSTPFVEYGGVVSPDGQWLAYGSNESGQWEVYVRPFPAGRGEWQISNGNRASEPRWSSKGDEVFFRTVVGLSSASVDISGESLRVKRPEPIFDDTGFVDLFPARDYNVAPGGEAFVFFKGAEDRDKLDHVILVTNWFDELERTFSTTGR